jgi:hypothetical protein
VVQVVGRVLRRVAAVTTRVIQPTWVEMPAGEASGVGAADPVDASAVLVHRGHKVYVLFDDPTAQAEALERPDVRPLSVEEMWQIESEMPGTFLGALLAQTNERYAANRRGPLGLGDFIHRVAIALRISECEACGRRRKRLNRFIVWGWWRT